MTRPPRSELTQNATYRDEVVELALTTFAVEGNATRAARIVKEQLGRGPGGDTIIKWAKDTHHARYLRIRENEAEAIKRRVATTVEDQLMKGLGVQDKAFDKAELDLAKLEPKDSAGALRNIATATGILATNLREMRPKDPIRVEHTLNADELFAKVAGLLGSDVATTVEGTAVELLPESSEPAEAGSERGGLEAG